MLRLLSSKLPPQTLLRLLYINFWKLCSICWMLRLLYTKWSICCMLLYTKVLQTVEHVLNAKSSYIQRFCKQWNICWMLRLLYTKLLQVEHVLNTKTAIYKGSANTVEDMLNVKTVIYKVSANRGAYWYAECCYIQRFCKQWSICWMIRLLYTKVLQTVEHMLNAKTAIYKGSANSGAHAEW